MRGFHLMQVESSLAGSVITDSSRMSLSSIDDGNSFTIKLSRIIDAFSFLALFHSQFTCVNLSLLLRAKTLKFYFFLLI